jgi:hypothetical protein
MDVDREIQEDRPFSLKVIAVSLTFGGVALIVVLAELFLPIPGTGVVTDPREIFTTLGAALTGPVGLWMGWGYKKLVFNRLQMPTMILGWAGLVLVFYFILAAPGFVIGQWLFYPDQYAVFYSEGASLVEVYMTLAQGVVPEALITTLITSLVIVALPRRYRRPLW